MAGLSSSRSVAITLCYRQRLKIDDAYLGPCRSGVRGGVDVTPDPDPD